jgi:beta-lactamase regulating signal transducer with metallopeptidase domain
VIDLLVNSTIKMSLVILLALAAMSLMRNRSAALRHWVLAVVVGCAAAIPALDAIKVAWPQAPESIQSTAQTGRPAMQTEMAAASVPAGGDASTDQTSLSNSFAFERIRPLSLMSVVSGLLGLLSLSRMSGLLRTIWLSGLFASLFVLLTGLGRLMWLASRSRRLTTGRWRELASEIADAYGLQRSLVLLQSDHPSLLVTWGFPVPKVILPAAAGEWSEDRARVVLWHELAHIRRGDWMVQMCVELLRAIYWFNPLLWVLSRRLRLESEHACDDEVMSRGVEAPDYATHLVDLARAMGRASRQSVPGLPAQAMARPSSLERRVRAMLNDRRNRKPVSGSTRVLIVAALLASTVVIATAQNVFSTFSGSVRDPQGAVLPGVTLVLTNAQKQTKYEVKSDRSGLFEFAGLQAGEYGLETRLPGFRTLRQSVSMSGENLDRDLVLQVGSLEETVTVMDQEIYDAAGGAVRQTSSPRPIPACAATTAVDANGGRIGGQIRAPIRIRNVRPQYPPTLHGTGTEGVVVMDGHIGLDGFIRDLQVRNQVHPDFAIAALSAVSEWQWDQTLLNCVPVEVLITVTAKFMPAR